MYYKNNSVIYVFIKKVLKPFWYGYKKMVKKRKSRFFLKHAKNTLIRFDNALTREGFHYTLAFGTLLGAIREKGFIKHDLDIDVFMWEDEWSKKIEDCLIRAGFKREHTFLIEGGKLGREETYEYNGVSIDIFYIYHSINENPYCCDFLAYPDCNTFEKSMEKYGGLIARKIEMPISKDIKKVQFEGLMLPVPSNHDELLSFRYGPDYMIPNPNWAIDSYDNHIRVWQGYKGEYIIG